jgi:hypothetical protein
MTIAESVSCVAAGAAFAWMTSGKWLDAGVAAAVMVAGIGAVWRGARKGP